MNVRTVFLFSLLCAANAGASVIDTTPAWDQIHGIDPWGADERATSTYGQTFTVGSVDTVLSSFSFYMTSANVRYQAYVAAWDGSKASQIIWDSRVLSANSGKPNFDFDTFKINTGALRLSANTEYAIFFSTAGLHGSYNDMSRWGFVGSDAYTGGHFVYTNNGNDKQALTGKEWDSAHNFPAMSADLAFQVELAPVPEPETWLMLLAGLGALALTARRGRGSRQQG